MRRQHSNRTLEQNAGLDVMVTDTCEVASKGLQGKYVKSKTLYILLVYLILSKDVLFRYFCIAVSRLPVIGQYYVVIQYGIPIVILMGAMPYILRKIRASDLLLYFAINVVAFSYATVNYLYTTIYFEQYVVSYITTVTPMLFIGLAFDGYINELSEKRMEVFCIASIASVAIMVKVTGFSVSADWSSDQSNPYYLLPYVLLLISYFTRKHNPLLLAEIIVSILFMSLFGNRGSLVCVFVFLIYLTSKGLINANVLLRTLILILLIVACFFVLTKAYVPYLEQLAAFSSDIGFSSRVMNMLLSGQFDDSGRGQLQAILISQIMNNPFGYGPSSAYYFVGQYAHNLFIELCLDYGWLFGVGSGFALIAVFVRGFIAASSDDGRSQDMIAIGIILSIVILLMSSTYLNSPSLFLTLGYCISEYRKRITRNSRVGMRRM